MTVAGPLVGKVALVTGASRGIGRAIAQRLAAAGASVVVTARSLDHARAEPGTLHETVGLIETAGGRAIALAADLDNVDERGALVEQAVAAAGGLDILVNNAGYAEYALVEAMTDEVFERTVNLYLRAPFTLSRAAIPHLRDRGGGWIVNIGSSTAQPPLRPYGDFDKYGGVTVYAAIKAALARFTQGLAAELIGDNIAVNLVAPSTAIRTPGAVRYIPDDYPGEDVGYLVETVFEMCRLPASERTGLLAHSMHFAHHHELKAMSIGDWKPLPPASVPAWSHPAISASGE